MDVNDTNEVQDTGIDEKKDEIKPLSTKDQLIHEKVMDMIDKILFSKTEDEIRQMSSGDIDKIIGTRALEILEKEAKKNHMSKEKFEEAKKDFILLLKSSLEAEQKVGTLQEELIKMQSQFDEELNHVMFNSDLDVAELIVDLCENNKYQNLDDKDANFKLYIRGLKRAGTLENMISTLNKYKFKVLYNLFTKSYESTKERTYKILSDYKEETFFDPRIISPTLTMMYESRFNSNVINMFSFIFYILFDHVKDGKLTLDLVTFTKYFLMQIHFLHSHNEFKSKELFTISVEKLLIKIEEVFMQNNIDVKIYENKI